MRRSIPVHRPARMNEFSNESCPEFFSSWWRPSDGDRRDHAAQHVMTPGVVNRQQQNASRHHEGRRTGASGGGAAGSAGWPSLNAR